MRYLQVLTFCLSCSSIALSQASTVSLSAGVSGGFISATATANPYNPQGCSTPSEPNNLGSLSISLPTNNCTEDGVDTNFSCTSNSAVSPGTYTVSASYSGFSGTTQNGTSCFVGGASASVDVVVSATQTVTTVQVPNSTIQIGQTLILPVVVSDNGSGEQDYESGFVTLYYGSRTIASQMISGISPPPSPSSGATITALAKGIPTGTYSLYVGYSGDENFSPSQSNNFAITVLPAQMVTTTYFSVEPNPIVKGEPASIGVTIAPSGPNTPTGSATILADGTKLTSVSLTNGEATLTLPADIAPGTYNLQAAYSGDSFNLPSTSSPVSVTVVAQTPTTTTVTITPTTIINGQAAQISASVTPQIGFTSPAGTVTISANGTKVTTLPLQNGAASVIFSTTGVPVGTYAVTGTYSGSATASQSTSAPQTVVIAPASGNRPVLGDRQANPNPELAETPPSTAP